MKRLEPDYVSVDITYRCNLRCEFCFLAANPGLLRDKKERTLRELSSLVDELSGKRRIFYVTGGEPFIRSDAVEFIERIKKRGHFCMVTTNGTLLTPGGIDRLLDCGTDSIVVSLHGDERAHDAACRKKGAWRLAAETMRNIASSRRKKNTRLHVWCTINRRNHARLAEFCRLFLSLGADRIDFNHLEFSAARQLAETRRLLAKAGLRTGALPSPGRAGGIDIGVLSGQESAVRALGLKNVVFAPDLRGEALARWYNPPSAPSRPGRCLGQWNSIWISPSGKLLSCQPLAAKMGTAKNCLEAFNGTAYSRLRASLEAGGGFLPLCARCGRMPYQTDRKVPIMA